MVLRGLSPRAPRAMARLFVQFHVNNFGTVRVRRCRIAVILFAAVIVAVVVILIFALGAALAALAALAAFGRRQNFVQEVVCLVVDEQAQGTFATLTFATFTFATFTFATRP